MIFSHIKETYNLNKNTSAVVSCTYPDATSTSSSTASPSVLVSVSCSCSSSTSSSGPSWDPSPDTWSYTYSFSAATFVVTSCVSTTGCNRDDRRINVHVYTIADGNNMKNCPEPNVFVSQSLEVATDKKKPFSTLCNQLLLPLSQNNKCQPNKAPSLQGIHKIYKCERSTPHAPYKQETIAFALLLQPSQSKRS